MTEPANRTHFASNLVRRVKISGLVVAIATCGVFVSGFALADDVIDLDKIGESDREKQVVDRLTPHLNRVVTVRFTVRYYGGGERNIYFDSERKGNEFEKYNLAITIPDDGTAKNGKPTWTAFLDVFKKAQNIKTIEEFRKHINGRRIQVTGKLIGGPNSAGSSSINEAAVQRKGDQPFKIFVTDPGQLKVLPK